VKAGRACIVLAATIGFASLGAPASEAAWTPAVSAKLTMTIPEAAPIWGSEPIAYRAPAIEFGATESGPAGVTTVSVRVHRGHAWSLRFSAPEGERLEVGEYTHALGLNDALHPGLDVSGEGRGCDNSTGSFTVHEVEYGQRDYVERFRATFAFSCQPGEPNLHGEVDLAARPAPKALAIEIGYRSGRIVERVDGARVELRGTVTCTQPVGALVRAEVVLESGPRSVGEVEVARCSGKPQPWKITSDPSESFVDGEAPLATIIAQATDQTYKEGPGESPILVEEVLREVEVEPLQRPDSARPPGTGVGEGAPQSSSVTIEVAYESGQIVQNVAGTPYAELRGTLRCSRPVRADVQAFVRTWTGYESPGGIEVDCAATRKPWLIETGLSSDLGVAEGPSPGRIEARAFDASTTDATGAHPTLAEQTLEVEVEPIPGPEAPSAWSVELFVLLAAAFVALAGWSLLIGRWARARRQARST